MGNQNRHSGLERVLQKEDRDRTETIDHVNYENLQRSVEEESMLPNQAPEEILNPSIDGTDIGDSTFLTSVKSWAKGLYDRLRKL